MRARYAEDEGRREDVLRRNREARDRRAARPPLVPTSKVCGTCHLEKPIDEFHAHATAPDRHQSRCKPCAVEIAMRWNKEHPEAFRRNARTHKLRKEYGITQAEYEAMVERQKGACAVCRRPPKTGRLHIDHDHDSGKVRGLLCMPCNSFLGKISEDVVILKRAVAYLTGHATLF